MKHSRIDYKKTKKKKVFKRIFLFITIPLLLIALYLGYTVYETIKAANNSYVALDRDKSKYREKPVEIRKDPFTILILGIEDYGSGGKGGRSDTIMVATFNPDDASMNLLSIPRDTRVNIAGRDEKDKINHAYSFGGLDMTVSTVEDFLEIPIDYYVTLDFDGFLNIIDTVGGVTVDVPFDFWDYKHGDWDTKLYFKEGKMRLNSEEALTYARMRKKDPRGDLGRTERQKQVVKALIDEINSPSTLFKVNDIVNDVGENVETNMRVNEVLAFQQKYSSFRASSINNLDLEGTDEYIGGIYYYIPDDTSLANLQIELKEHLEMD
ncbi:LCP family protein [Sutcliffiella horikoshii]|uniref:LCP family protein n=1 Tax=Sutcliffiella horikoshii TaxID=79883 RepID=UPI001F415E1F|nr:LCP family protein [Sutcliffiella horikoshii]MCG1021571.1 LytR family transcriptional regulator [Sutcliffiella horikoshii]